MASATRLLTPAPEDLRRYARLRRRALALVPWAFDAGPDDDYAATPAQIASLIAPAAGAIVVVDDLAGGELAAIAGLARSPHAKSAHRATLWGVFTAPEHRGRGLGHAVVTAAIALARSWRGVDSIRLSVSAETPDAQRLYERVGFRVWGREPAYLAHDGRRIDELHMLLQLAAPAGLRACEEITGSAVDRLAR